MYPNSRVTGQLVTVLVVILLLGSVVAGPAASQQSPSETDDNSDIDPADDAYITEDGAVLVYSEESEDSELVAMNFGADVTTGLVSAVIESEDTADNVTGSLGLEARPDSFSGNGNLSFQNVDDVNDFSFSAEGEHSRSDSYVTASLTTELEEQGATTGETTGEITTTPDQFSLTTDVQVGNEFNREAANRRIDLRIEENADGFIASVDEKKQVWFDEGRWDTEENATRTLEQQYATLVRQFGGTAEVSLDSYEYEPGDQESGGTLDVSYTVTLSDVRSGITDQIIAGIAADERIDISPEQRTALKDSLDDLEIDLIEISYAQGPFGQMVGNATVEFSNYRSPMLTYMENVAGQQDLVSEEQLTEVRETFDAQEAANLQQKVTWDVSLTQGDQAGVLSLDATAAYETENWEAFMKERYGDKTADHFDASFDVTAESGEGDIAVDMTFQVAREDLIDRAIEQGMSDYLGTETVSMGDDEMQFLNAFDESDIQVAKSDIILGEETVEVTAAGQFENLSAFGQTTDLPADTSISHIHGELSGDNTGEIYVYVENEDLTADTVRETPFADENTTVHAEGEWDREFARMDLTRASEYLGVDVDDADMGDDENADTDESGDDGENEQESESNLPMTLLAGGVVVAVVAGVVVFRYR